MSNLPVVTRPRGHILSHAAWMAWSGAVSIANGIALWVAMARCRTPAEVGQFSAMIGLQTIFISLSSLGLGPYLTSEIARRRDSRAFVAGATALITGSSILGTLVMAAAGSLLYQSTTARLAAVVLSLAILPSGLISLAESIFIALGRTRLIALTATTENFLRTVIPLWLLHRGYSLPAICLSLVIVRLTACAAYAVVARHQLKALKAVSWSQLSQIAAAAPAFACVNLLSALHWQLGAVLAHRLGGEGPAAEFGVASRFLVPATIVVCSYAGVIQPAVSGMALKSLTRTQAFLSRSLRLVNALLLPVVLVLVMLGAQLLEWVFGGPYTTAAPAVYLLGATAIPFGAVMIASRGLIATGRQRYDVIGNLAAVTTNLVLNLALIPRFGALGAAAAQFISVSAMALVVVHYGSGPLFRLNVWSSILVFRWPLAGMAVAIELTGSLGICAAVFAGGAVYLVGLRLIRRQLLLAGDRRRPRLLPRILMVGADPAGTLGGISTIIKDLMHSSLTREFEFRHLGSQSDLATRPGKALLAIAALTKFSFVLAMRRPELVYVHVGGGASLYRKAPFIMIARLFRRPVVTHFHAGDFDLYYHRQPAFGRSLIRYGLGLSNQIITVSEHWGRRLREFLPGAAITVIPNWVEVSLFEKDAVSSDSLIRILFAGTIGRLKGESDLIAALKKIPDHTPSVRLIILGTGADQLKPRLEAAGLWPSVEFLGPVSYERRADFFKRADLFVLPTYAEGMPIAILEAMAAALPVVTTTVGGIPELIQDGVEGYLIAPGDVDALANRIAGLIDHPNQRRRLGLNALAKAQRFDREKSISRLSAELHILLSEKSEIDRI